MGGSMRGLKNGWGFDSTVSLQSGQPFTLNYSCEDDYSGGGDCFDRPDVVGPIVYHQHNPYNYLDLTAFAMPGRTTEPFQVSRPTVCLERGTTAT